MSKQDEEQGKILQARVDATMSAKFAAVARLRGMKDSDLLRYSIELMFQHELDNLDEYESEQIRVIKAAREALTS